MGNDIDIAHEEVAEARPPRAPQPTFLGQTKATWYIYWICGVASIANMYEDFNTGIQEERLTALLRRFQGFDSGIYSVILADKHFIEYFNVGGARSGVVASMSKSFCGCSLKRVRKGC